MSSTSGYQEIREPFAIGSISEFAGKLTLAQQNMIDAIWGRLVQCGKPTPKRSLPVIIGKTSITEAFNGLAREFVFEVSDGADACYSLTSYGAFLTGQGIELAVLLVRLLELVKTLHERDPYIKTIDKDQVQHLLGISLAETHLIFTLLQIRLPARFPIYISSCNPDGSSWVLSITDEVIELHDASNVTTYVDERLTAGLRKEDSKTININPLTLLQTRGELDVQHNISYLHSSRIDDLKSFANTNFDCTRLICLCEELNDTALRGNVHAVIMLTRAILDHIPPIFGHTTFTQVASNYAGGGASFKKSMERLDNHARKVADRFLHMQIRPKEVTPNMNEVNFAQELETLMAEVCRLLK